MRKSLESRVVIVPSKSVKKMNLGLVFMAGRAEEDILANTELVFKETKESVCTPSQ